MPAPIPIRNRNVYFVGAGVSVAMGLPNTAMLLDGVLDLSRRSARWQNEGLEDRLQRAFKYFYPDAIHAGYRTDVVDFFSALRTYLDVGVGLRGGFTEAPHLYRSLKSAIGHMLIEKLRQCDKALKAGHPYLSEMLTPGNIIITSNWDLLIERYAQLHRIPLRPSGLGSTEEVALLNLDTPLGRSAGRG